MILITGLCYKSIAESALKNSETGVQDSLKHFFHILNDHCADENEMGISL